MLMGPFFVAELTTAARRKRYYWLRVLYASAMLFILWMNYLSIYWYNSTVSAIASFAQAFFYSFAVLQETAIFLVLPAMVAGAIAQERERRTIEYLLTSQLTSLEIILGKLGARLTQAAVLLMTGFAILSIALMLGGIAGKSLLLSFMAVLVLLVELGGVSILISTWSRRSRDALRNIYIFLFVWSVAPIWIAALFEWMLPYNLRIYLIWAGFAISPWGICVATLESDEPTSIALMAAGHLAFGALCITAAVLTLRRAYDRGDVVPTEAPRRWRFSLRSIAGGFRSKAAEAQGPPAESQIQPMLESHPMRWKEIYPRPKKRWLTSILMLAAFATLVGPLVAFGLNNDLDDYPRFVQVTSTIILSASLLLVAARAASSVTIEMERDSWTTLLSTILPADEIVMGKVWGAVHSARWLFLLTLALWIFAAIIDYAMILALVTQTIVFVPCCVFCAALGVRFSLRSTTSIAAMAKTIALLLFLNGGYLLLVIPFLALAGFGDGPWFMAPCMPFLIAMAPEFAFQLQEPDYGRYFGSFYSHAMAAGVIGTVGYAFATITTLAACIGRFDIWTERTRPSDGLLVIRNNTTEC